MEGGVVYSRVPRTTGTYTLEKNGEIFDVSVLDTYDRLPEVTHRYFNFNGPGQLILRDSNGNEKVIYDCFKELVPCVPFDAMVSPDGSKIAFSVFRSGSFIKAWASGIYLPNQRLNNDKPESQIYVYDVAAATLQAWPYLPGVQDSGPAWLPDGRVVFTSNRGTGARPWMYTSGNPVNSVAHGIAQPQLFIANADGSNAKNISPHEVSSAMHPYVTADGRILYSSMWTSHNLPYEVNNGAVGGMSTQENRWVIQSTDSTGGDTLGHIGTHEHYFRDQWGQPDSIKALHFLTQLANGDICAVIYYRGNNLSLGNNLCWGQEEPRTIEGKPPTFFPSKLYTLTRWGMSADRVATMHEYETGRFQGKVGYPDGTNDGQAIMTVGRGLCSQAAIVPETVQVVAEGRIGCDVGIYKTTKIPSENISDLTVIVDDPEWQEFNARAIQKRDIQEWPLRKTAGGDCELASADAQTTDAFMYKGYDFNWNQWASAHNGYNTGIPNTEIQAIRFFEVVPNTAKPYPPDFKNSIGNVVRLIGDAPLYADGSFKAKLPCDTPYLMAGVDSEGRILRRDQVPQSLRPGEQRTCSGCHLHGSEGRNFEDSLAFTSQAIDLTAPSIPVPTYTKDIRPILESRCASCHEGDYVMGGYQSLVWDFTQSAVPEEKRFVMRPESTFPRTRYGFERPFISRAVSTMYAIESPLYWYAKGERTVRTNDDYDDDIDFNGPHQTEITPEELKILALWLDTGAQL